MNNRNSKYILFIIILVVSVLCILGIGINAHRIRLRVEENTIKEQKILEEVAARIGVQEDWVAVREYVYCETLKQGISREEIYKKLSLVGEYSTTITGNTIIFTEHYRYKALCPISVRYDENNKLIDAYAGEQNRGPKTWCELGEPSPTPKIEGK